MGSEYDEVISANVVVAVHCLHTVIWRKGTRMKSGRILAGKKDNEGDRMREMSGDQLLLTSREKNLQGQLQRGKIAKYIVTILSSPGDTCSR